MKKIGTITFHWATNYGAVLQTYALQQFLIQNNIKTEVINYVPLRPNIIQFIEMIKKLELKFFIKYRRIAKFRKQHIVCSKKTYYTNNALMKIQDQYSAIICGSDQIWNPSFTLRAEGKPTLSYYLNFASDNTIRIAYAASFGTDSVSQEYYSVIKNEIKKFQYISVREQTGQVILNKVHIKSRIVCDPVLLLNKESYEKFYFKSDGHPFVFTYILHGEREQANKVIEAVSKINGGIKYKSGESCSVEQWISK